MAEIKPFRGLRYNLAKVGMNYIREVVCPPYDVIGREAQHRYLERNPYNIVRLELGETFPEDTSQNNRYTRAAAVLRHWEADELLIRDEYPAFYLYEQEFNLYGIRHKRRALITALHLEDYSRNIVIPHERTLPHALADRLALLEAINTNLSPIFCLYDDPQGQVAAFCNSTLDLPPLYNFSDEWNDLHRLYLIHDPDVIKLLQKAFSRKKLYIADGHHRYHTALTYREERHRAGARAGGPQDYILAGLTAFQDQGLSITPLHRLVGGLTAGQVRDMQANLTNYFETGEISLAGQSNPAFFAAELVRQATKRSGPDESSNPTIGMYCRLPEAKFTLLKLKDGANAEDWMPLRSKAWQQLEVSILHTLVLENSLNLGEGDRLEEMVTYTRDEREAFARVNEGAAQIAFLLPPTRLEAMRTVSDMHEQMPPKSTFFYPKFMTGLVMRPLD